MLPKQVKRFQIFEKVSRKVSLNLLVLHDLIFSVADEGCFLQVGRPTRDAVSVSSTTATQSVIRKDSTPPTEPPSYQRSHTLFTY
jgi:hypothetical protein